MVVVVPRCLGCGAVVSEQHDRVCDVARCRATGLQFHACDHQSQSLVPHEPDRWTGRWPGEEDCERVGWFARSEPGTGWVPCGRDAPDAQPDIARLQTDAVWEPITGRWMPIEHVDPLRSTAPHGGGAGSAPHLRPLWGPLAALGASLGVAIALPPSFVPFVVLLGAALYWLIGYRLIAGSWPAALWRSSRSRGASPAGSPTRDGFDGR